MDQKLKERWLEALASGRYKKGIKTMRRYDDTFCCLGVLADINDPDCWTFRKSSSTDEEDKWGIEHFKDGYCQALLPDDLAEELGLNDTIQWALANLNDASMTFEPVIK